MTAALFFAPMSPPGTSPPRQAQGADSTDLTGLFALLLAGAQPAEANVVAGAQATIRPTVAPPPADTVAPQAAPAPAMSMRPNLGALGPATAPAPPAAAALVMPPPTAVSAQADPGQGGSLPQLRAPSRPTQALQSPEPLPAQGTHRIRTPLAPNAVLDHRIDVVGHSAGNADAPPRPATTAHHPLPPPPSGAAARAHAASIREAPIASFADARVPIAADLRSPQSTTPRRVAGATAVIPRVPLFSTTANRAMAMPSPEVMRANPPIFATVFASPGPAADQPAVTDQGRLEAAFESLESALGRSEQSTPDPVRLAAPGRTAPPAPVFQIGVQIARAVPARIDRLFVQLEPAALGRVEVRLEFHRDNQVSAMIAAERPDTLDALQRDARLLERSLHDAGLRLDSDGLTFSLKREQAQDQTREHAPFALPADDAGPRSLLTPPDDERPPLHWFHGLRTLDIRI